MKLYAGIGARKTPSVIQTFMVIVSFILKEKGYTLRSGAAEGADESFELGAGEQKEIYLPNSGFNNSKSTLIPTEFSNASEIIGIASAIHPKWPKLDQKSKNLHSRNVCQILGQDLESPVDMVLCWTPDGAEKFDDVNINTGGTGTAIKIASKMDIPVLNMYNKKSFCTIIDLVGYDDIISNISQLQDSLDSNVLMELLDMIERCN